MATVVEQLKQLGFAEYEAKAYVGLLRHSPLNGYELAKRSGVPRADIYAALQRLEERGAVVRADTEAGARYAPVPPTELIHRLDDRFRETVEAAERSLAEVAGAPEHEYVWNASGYDVVLDHARSLIDRADRRLLMAASTRDAPALTESLASAETRGVEITTLCLEACPSECGNCRGRIHRHRVAPADSDRWLVLVQDEVEALAAEIDGDGQAMAVRTRQPLLVGLVAWYLRHSIALGTLIDDLGYTIEPLLRPETRDVLASIGPEGPEGGWLEHLRALAGQS